MGALVWNFLCIQDKKKIMKYIFLFIIPALFFSCHKNAPDGSLQEFSDNFEAYSDTNGIVGSADNQWTEYNINEINVSANPVSIDTAIVHSGKKSIRFDCLQNDPEMKEVCKCNLNKGNLNFRQGETVYYSAWYYIQHQDMHYGTFFVWDLGQIVEGSLEIRVMAWEENLELERNKLGMSNIFQEQPAVLFSVNQWAHLELEVKLSQHRKGSVKMCLDGKEIINKEDIITMPKDRINMVWGTKGFYERVQCGITAKNGTQDLIMYMDDVEIRRK